MSDIFDHAAEADAFPLGMHYTNRIGVPEMTKPKATKETLVVITESGNISEYYLNKLQEAGAVVIVAMDINKVKVLGQEEQSELRELFYFALASMRNNTQASANFGAKLMAKLCKDSGYYEWSKGGDAKNE